MDCNAFIIFIEISQSDDQSDDDSVGRGRCTVDAICHWIALDGMFVILNYDLFCNYVIWRQ